jgi:TIR domain-containing protein
VADVFISFRTGDTERVQPVYNALGARGLTVFWSNAIPTGAPNYQTIIEAELHAASVVLVFWTHWSVRSNPVIQECLQALRYEKLMQVVLDDDIPPIRFPMEVPYKAQKAMLINWVGDVEHPGWRKLNEAIDAQIRYHNSPEHGTSAGNLHMLVDRARDRHRWHEERGKARRQQAAKVHMIPGQRVTARDPGFGPITVHVQTDAGEVWLTVDRALSDELDKRKRLAEYHNKWPVRWTVPAERGPAPFVTLALTRNDAKMLTFPKPKA